MSMILKITFGLLRTQLVGGQRSALKDGRMDSATPWCIPSKDGH